MSIFLIETVQQHYAPSSERWAAYYSNDEEGPQGSGPTEEAAISDLINNYDLQPAERVS